MANCFENLKPWVKADCKPVILPVTDLPLPGDADYNHFYMLPNGSLYYLTENRDGFYIIGGQIATQCVDNNTIVYDPNGCLSSPMLLQEITRAEGKDSDHDYAIAALEGEIEDVKDDLQGQINDLTSQDIVLAEAISDNTTLIRQEVTDRTNADNALDARITSLETALVAGTLMDVYRFLRDYGSITTIEKSEFTQSAIAGMRVNRTIFIDKSNTTALVTDITSTHVTLQTIAIEENIYTIVTTQLLTPSLGIDITLEYDKITDVTRNGEPITKQAFSSESRGIDNCYVGNAGTSQFIGGNLRKISGGSLDIIVTAIYVATASTTFTGMTYKGKLQYGADTVATMDTITGQVVGDVCGVQETQSTYQWDGSQWVELPHGQDAVGDLYKIAAWYGISNGVTYTGDATADILCSDATTPVFDLFVYGTTIPDLSITQDKLDMSLQFFIGAMDNHRNNATIHVTAADKSSWNAKQSTTVTITDAAESATLPPVGSPTITSVLQALRNNVRYLLNRINKCPYEVGDIYITVSSNYDTAAKVAARWAGTSWEQLPTSRYLLTMGQDIGIVPGYMDGSWDGTSGNSNIANTGDTALDNEWFMPAHAHSTDNGYKFLCVEDAVDVLGLWNGGTWSPSGAARYFLYSLTGGHYTERWVSQTRGSNGYHSHVMQHTHNVFTQLPYYAVAAFRRTA